jgi:hypothetical protein
MVDSAQAPAAETPWRAREKSIRPLGRIRRAIADAAMAGDLPTEAQRLEYRRAEAAYEAAHEAWLASRQQRSE